MFTSSSLRDAAERSGLRRKPVVTGGSLPAFVLAEEEDRRPLRIAFLTAVLLHAGLFVVTFPQTAAPPPRNLTVPRPVFAVRQVRFSPPPPRGTEAPRPERREKRRIIPIPDPTPDDPEPIRLVETVAPSLDSVLDDDAIYGVPEGVPGPGEAFTGDLVALGGNVVAPLKVYSPQPAYTEEARQARVQGVVILQAIVDAVGAVTNVEVLKGLPNGLSESAVAAVRQWRFRPATLDGRPVAVYYNFTISFGLQ